MKWHVYKKDDPNTWPQIDCPMVVWTGEDMFLCDWYNDERKMFDFSETTDPACYERFRYLTEFYYAYMGYVPSGYKTLHPTKCAYDKYCPHGFDDDGYCMSGRTFACKYKRDITEYLIKEEAIWKEFE